MFVFSAAIKIILSKWPRVILFMLAAAALIFSFGTLGQSILYSDIITDPLSIIIVDYDESLESRMITQMFQDYEMYRDIVNFSTNTESAAMAEIKANRAAAVLLLPENFAENLKNGANEPFTVILNEAQPIKRALVEYIANAFSDTLAASQSGVYAALDYTWQNFPESYDRMFMIVNLRFINMVLNRADMLDTETVSAIASIPVFLHFAVSFWIFLNIAAISLFADVFITNFNPFILKKIYLSGTNMFLFVLQLIFAFFALFAAINAGLLIPVFYSLSLPEISPPLIAAPALALFCVSALAVFVLFIFKHSSSACIIITAVSVCGLFLSGGIIPREFFAPQFKNLSYLTLNYWLYEAVTGIFTDSFLGIWAAAAFGLLFFLLSVMTVFCKGVLRPYQ